jgi:hypothetical protein
MNASQERRMKIKRGIFIFIISLAVLASFQCKSEKKVKGISLEVSFSEKKLTDNLITDIRYNWKTKNNFAKLSDKCAIFVHFWDRHNLIFYDNHTPEIPLSKWEPGKEYSYQRRIYIPYFIDANDPEFKEFEILRLSVGIAFPVSKAEKPLRKVYEKKLKVFPPLDAPKITYEDGWYGYEINPEAALKRWRWTGREARCVIDNPHRDALLVIKGGVRKETVASQKIVFKIGDFILDDFVPEDILFEKSYSIKKEILGEGNKFPLIISTDKTFIPADVIPGSKDKRELGVQISFLYFR